MTEDEVEWKPEEIQEEKKPKKKIIEAKPQPKTVDASKLQELFEKRPIFSGREYHELNMWYEELRRLTE